VEGVLNPDNWISASGSAAVSGEAPRTLFVEGVLNPDNCLLNPEIGRAAPCGTAQRSRREGVIRTYVQDIYPIFTINAAAVSPAAQPVNSP
jgi:hypothetical protein